MPKFKIGDKLEHIQFERFRSVIDITNDGYTLIVVDISVFEIHFDFKYIDKYYKKIGEFDSLQIEQLMLLSMGLGAKL